MTIKWTKNPMEHHIPLTLSGAKLKKKKRKMCHVSIMGHVERGGVTE